MSTPLRHTRMLLLVLLLIPIAGLAQSLSATPDLNDAASFDKMAEYLARGSGKWKADNPQYDPSNPNMPKAFGLWFNRGLEGHLLDIKIVVYVGEQVYTSSQGSWLWHPGKQHILYLTTGWDGTVSEGVTEFTSADTFITITDVFAPDRSKSRFKDENVMIEADVHENTSYSLNEKGEWVLQGVFRWQRLAEEN